MPRLVRVAQLLHFLLTNLPCLQPFAHKIKDAVGDKILVSTVGGIKEGYIAKQCIDNGLDVVFVGRMFQKNPGLLFRFGDELEVDVRMPNQISWAFRGRGGSK